MALEEEAQICRLCGQCESIYIDVFGEEGTKRYLSRKIHTKINILIKEDDGLPKKVCMRCIGTLEFVSDFHIKCHQTQRQLLRAKDRTQILSKDEIKTDLESDKENALPLTNVDPKENVNGLPDPPRRKSSRMENKVEQVKKVRYKNEVLRDDMVRDLEKEENHMGNSEIIRSSGLKRRTVEAKGHLIHGRRMAVPRKRTPLLMEIPNQNGNGNGQDEVQATRPSRRNTGKKGSTSSIINRKMRKSETNAPRLDSRTNSPIRSNSAKASLVERTEDYVESPDKEPHREEIESYITIPQNMVKLENSDLNNVPPGADSLPLIPNGVLLPKAPLGPLCSESIATSPRPGDEARGRRDRECDAIEGQTADDASKTVCMKDDGAREKKSLLQASTVRKSVIESVKKGDTFRKDIEYGAASLNGTSSKVSCQKSKTKLTEGPDSLVGSMTGPRNSLDMSSDESNKTGGESVGDFRKRRKKSEGQFGKLSELITNEQKEIIETLYTVNMGVVDNEEVYKNIKILDKIKVKCDICGKTYPRMDKCQVHVWGHLNMKPYCCKSCDFVTLTVSNIRCHIRKRHLKIKPFQCNLCEKSYGTAVLLEEHINSHTGAKPYKCKQCDFATSNRQVLSYHKTTHKPVKDISCEVCGKKFFSNCRMRAHMLVHNKDRNLMCKLCSTYLCNAEALVKHHQKVHSRDYVCETCGIRTRSRKALTNHENVHLAAKFRCPLCPNVYKSKHMLKEHLFKHQGIRKYKCELCNKSFAQQSHIAAHMSVHMGKRYPCPGCNKLFNRRDNMRIHTRRCKVFKSNPDIEDPCIGPSSTLPPQTDDRLMVVSQLPAAPTAVTDTVENSKADRETSETDIGLMRINEVTDKTDDSGSRNLNTVLRDSQESRNATRDRESFYQFRPNREEMIPLSNSNVTTTPHERNTVITENVLTPECF